MLDVNTRKINTKERALKLYKARRKHFTANGKELERKSLAILQAIPDSLAIVNLNGDILYYKVGVDQEYIKERLSNVKHLRVFLPDSQLDEFLKVILEVIQTGQTKISEFSITFPDVGDRSFQYHISPYGEDAVLVISHDITKQKHLEKTLRYNEARYRSVVDTQTEFICRFNRQGIVTFINEAANLIFEGGRQEILGHNISEYLGQVDPLMDQQAISATFNLTPGNSSLSTEIRLDLPNLPMMVLAVTTSAIFNEQGEAVEFQTTGRDITDLKKAQEIQEKQNALLMQLGEQLINIQEDERQRIARELHDAVLNELGAMLIAPSDMLTPKVVRENYTKLIGQLRQTINGLRSPMINFGLYTALEDLYDTLTDNYQVQGVLTLDIPSSQYRFDANIELHLFRIIQQACDNAIKHAQAKHIHVTGLIEAEWVDITVEDDGIGFERQAENKLAYFLAHKRFGLISMVERGKLIGAEVKIISQPGSGTQVRVFWDARKSP